MIEINLYLIYFLRLFNFVTYINSVNPMIMEVTG